MTTPEQPTAAPDGDVETTPSGEQLHVVETEEVVETNQPTDAWGED